MHLFFASHYQQDWYSGWENKWYGGFNVYVTAPLVHQLIALLGNVVTLESGYLIIQGIALATLPIAIALFTKEVFDEETAGIAALLSTGIAGTYVVLYTFGQLPFFVATCVSLIASTLYARYLRFGQSIELLSWIFASGVAVATHHHSSLMMLPLLAMVVTSTQWIKRFSWISIVRAMVAGLTFTVTGIIVIYPFWWWYFTQRLPQMEIYHPSRDAYLHAYEFARMFFWDMYGGVIVLLPALALGFTRKKLLPLLMLIMLLAILGLGGNTDIPQKLLGSMWNTLTFERFSFWAAVLAIMPAAYIVKDLKGRLMILFAVVTTIAMLIGIVRAVTFPHQKELLQQPLTQWEEHEIVRFLDDHQEYNYVTLGLGEPEMVRISRLTRAWTVDGFYHQARSRQELRDSLIGTIDSSEWEGEKSYAVLFEILQYPADWQVRWIVSATPWAEGHLRNSGWTLLHPIGSQLGWEMGDRYYSNVTVWEAPAMHLPDIRERHITNHPGRFFTRQFLPLLWGLTPLIFLILAIICSYSSWSMENV